MLTKSQAGKLGRIAVNKKYSSECKRKWWQKGALTLNKIITKQNRSLGGFSQSIQAKSKGAFNSAKKQKLNEA